MKKEVDKATISSFNISGVKVGVDFKGIVIAQVNVEAVEFYAEAFRGIDAVIFFFAWSFTFGLRAIVCTGVGILIIFGRVLGARGFGDINLSVRIKSKLTAFIDDSP